MTARFDAAPCPTPWWLPGGHSQTLYAARLARCPVVHFARERVETPDNDFVEIDWNVPGWGVQQLQACLAHGVTEGQLEAALTRGPARQERKAVALFHGLEGSSQSHYVRAIAHHFRARGWVVAVPHFRGCSGLPNHLLRAYHSGDTQEIAFLLATVRRRLPNARWYAIGISLGGNALAKFLGHMPADRRLRAAAAVSAPLDLMTCGMHLSQGFWQRHIYTRHFLQTLKTKVLRKAQRYPGAFDAWRVAQARTLYEFDDAYTAPVHGFDSVEDYWRQASALPDLPGITVPTLILNARNDPFVPLTSLPNVNQASRQVLLHQPDHGGHAGFVTGNGRGHLHWLPRRIERFFATGH